MGRPSGIPRRERQQRGSEDRPRPPRALTAPASAQVPNVLLLTGHAPGNQGVAQIFLHDLIIAYPHDRISCFTVGYAGVGSDDLGWLKEGFAQRPREGGIGRFGAMVRDVSGYVYWQYTRLVKLPRIARDIVRFAREQKAELLWAVVSSPALVFLSRRVARDAGIPLVTTVWDPPELLIRNGGFSRIAASALHREFARVLQQSVRCGVASEGMAEEYANEFGAECVVLINGADAEARQPVSALPPDGGELTIGFAGSFYTKDEWRALLAGLASANWSIAGRKVRLRVLATKLPFYLDESASVEYLGWLSPAKAIEELSKCDVLYLPYWFDAGYRDIVRLCFPNKIGTYLAAGRPIFYHGPKDSSPSRFLERYPAGIECNGNSPDEILRALRRFVDEPELYARAAGAIGKALDEELNLRVFRNRFARMIGIDPSRLLGS